MIIIGACQDKGLMDLLLQDLRKLSGGMEVVKLDPGLPRDNLVEIVKGYQKQSKVYFGVLDAENVPASQLARLAEFSDAMFTYYRQNGNRWFKFLKNRLKPVSVDYQLVDFWFMLGSIYTALITQSLEENIDDSI